MNLELLLRTARIQANVSQRTISEALGYTTPQFISKLGARSSSRPPIELLKTLSKFYEVDVEKLL